MKKQLIVFASLVTVVGAAASLTSTSLVSAQSLTTKSATSSSTSKLHPRIRRARTSAKLNQAVRDNTITAAQKTSLITEMKQLRSERKSVITKTSTTAQRQAERTKLKSELQAWASSNNFPLSKVFPKLAD
jgi:predicted flavoprotein YhiN